MFTIKRAIFVTYDKFPDIDAGAVRTHMFANMLRDGGYRVRVISMGPNTDNQVKQLDGIEYKSYRLKNNTFLGKVLAYLIFPIRLFKELKNYKPDICFHTQVRKNVLAMLKKYCKKNNKNLVYDAVEWFSPEQYKNGEKAKPYQLNDAYNRCLVNENHKVISISTYLDEHFKNRKICSMNIPVILDVKNTNIVKDNTYKKIKIIYAGSPGKKDYLDVIIHALAKLNQEELDKIEFSVIGCTKENLIEVCGVSVDDIAILNDSLIIKGRMSREDVIKEYESANFSILIRSQKQRYAKAGFPTKFVESLSLSTPVICNLTSDLGDYVVDGVNGVLVENESVEACYKAFKNVLSFDKEQLQNMQNGALKTAISRFDYRLYIKKLLDFVE